MKDFTHILQYALLRLTLGVLSILPLKTIGFIAASLGTFIASLPIQKNVIARKNIRLCFPEMDEISVQKTHEKATQNFVQTLLEMPKIYALRGDKFYKHVKVVGIEYLRNDTSRFILTAHYGNWELINKSIGFYGIPMASIYRRANNPYVDKYITQLRAQETGLMIPKGKNGAKELIKAVKNGMCAGFLNDQKMSDGTPSTFFNQEVKSPSAIADLALKYNRDVIPVFCERLGLGQYQLTFHPPIQIKKTDEVKKDSNHAVQMFNSIIEEQIKKDPTQWLWHHKRFG